MNRIYELAVENLPQFQSLTTSAKSFFKRYFELWVQSDGCRESNEYFANAEGFCVAVIEKRFKQLRDAKVLKTRISKFYEPAVSKSGFITTRVTTLDPLFKAQMEENVAKIKAKINERKSIVGVIKNAK